MKLSEDAEKILEKLWIYPEENNGELMPFQKEFHDKDSFKELENLKLVNHNDDRIYLTSDGLKQTKKIVKKYGLIKELVHNISISPIDDIEASFMDRKHILMCECSKEGYCSCGGKNCKCFPVMNKPIQNDIKPVYGLKKGQSGKIVCIHSKKHDNLHKILSNGFLPGKKVTILRKRPINVLQIENNTIAVGNEIANSIYVGG